MEKKLYLATVIAVIAIAAAVLYSGSSYFTDKEVIDDCSFTAGTTGCCDCILVVNLTSETYIDYSCICDQGCECGELNQTELEECVNELKTGVISPGKIRQCLEKAGFIQDKPGSDWLAHGIKEGSIIMYFPRCCCGWGGD